MNLSSAFRTLTAVTEMNYWPSTSFHIVVLFTAFTQMPEIQCNNSRHTILRCANGKRIFPIIAFSPAWQQISNTKAAAVNGKLHFSSNCFCVFSVKKFFSRASHSFRGAFQSEHFRLRIGNRRDRMRTQVWQRWNAATHEEWLNQAKPLDPHQAYK